MKRFLNPFLRACFISAVVVCVASCAGMQTQLSKVASEPAPKFRLSASGLPEGGMWKCTPLFADVNQDGHLDLLAIVRLGDGAHVWLGDGKGNWKDTSQGLAMQNGSCGGGIAVGDISKSGRRDLVVADHCSGLYVYLQQPDGSWKPVVEGLYPPVLQTKIAPDDDATKVVFIGAEDVALGDINEDGRLDIVAPASDQGGFEVYLGDCTGKNWKYSINNGIPNLEYPEPEDEDNAGWANRIILADINKDGHLDVLASYYKGPRVWLGDGKGQFKGASLGLPEPPIGGLYRGLDFGDLNEDGLLDMVAANDVNGPEIYLQQPNGSWKFTGDVFPALQDGAVGVTLGDFTQSGHLDILVAGRKTKAMGSNGGLYLLKGDGKGSCKELENTDLPAQGLSVPWGVAVGDFNKDGRLDFAASTGGAVAGAAEKQAKKPPKAAPKDAGKPQPNVVQELKLPHLQAWVNEGVK